MNHVLMLCEVLKQYEYMRPAVLVFPGFKSALDFVDGSVFPKTLVSTVHVNKVCENHPVRVYKELSKSFLMFVKSLFSPFLFDFTNER